MPVYTVQDPDSGRTVKLEGDSPPTEQELEQIFANLPAPTTQAQQEPNAGENTVLRGSQPPSQQQPSQPQQQREMPGAFDAMSDSGLMTSAFEAIGQSNPLVREAVGAYEAAKATGSALGNQAMNGIRSLLTWAGTGDLDKAVNAAQDQSQEMPPMTSKGRERLGQFVDVLDTTGQALSVPPSYLYAAGKSLNPGETKKIQELAAEFQADPSKVIGNETFELTGSPEAAAIATVAPEIAGILFGTKGAESVRGFAKKRQENRIRDFMQAVEEGQNVKGQMTLPNRRNDGFAGQDETWRSEQANTDRVAGDDELRTAIARREGDYEKAADDLYRSGARVGRQNKLNRAIKQGFSEDVLSELPALNKATRNEVKVMTGLARRNLNATRSAKDANRLLKIPGRAVEKQFNKLMTYRRKKGQELRDFVKNEMAGQKIDINNELANFENTLAEQGLRLMRNPDGSIQQDAAGRVQLDVDSDRPMGNVSARKDVRTIQSFLNRMTKGNGEIDARAVHTLKKDIQDTLAEKNPNKSLGQMATRTLNSLQRELNGVLRNQNARYAEINDQISPVIELTNQLEKTFKGVDQAKDTTDQQLGVALRKLESNYASGSQIREVINEMDSISKQLGVESEIDIPRLTSIALELERKLDFTPRGTFAGQTQQGAGAAINTAAEMMTGNAPFTMLQKAGQKMDAMRGRKPENALNAFEDLLDTEGN